MMDRDEAIAEARKSGKPWKAICAEYHISRRTAQRICRDKGVDQRRVYSAVRASAPQTNICVSCKNACGGCCWSEYDSIAKKVRFEPVPGWTAEKAILHARCKSEQPVETFHITACPLYVPDRREG